MISHGDENTRGANRHVPRAEVRSAWLESLGERRQYPLRLQAFESAGGGWRKATLTCEDCRDAEAIRLLCPEHSVAVLCERRIDEQDPWPRSVAGHDLPLAVAAFVEKVTTQEGLVEVKFFVSNEAAATTDAAAVGWKPWHVSLRQRERAVLEAFEVRILAPHTPAFSRSISTRFTYQCMYEYSLRHSTAQCSAVQYSVQM